MALPRFDICEPQTLDEALQILAGARSKPAGTSKAVPLAGGTDLLVAMKKTRKAPGLVVSLQRIPGLDKIVQKNGVVEIGPLVTMTALCRSETVQTRIPVLADGAWSVAAPLIRNRATVGGNLCNARPCADTAPALMALGATLVLARAGGTREVPLDSFIKGPGDTVIEPDELLTAIRVPLPTAHSSGSYQKMIRRQTLDITIVGVASQISLDGPGGAVIAARIFATSVAPVPLRLPAAEKCVIGKPLSHDTMAAAGEAASKEVKPIDDLRGEAWYRRHASGVLTRRSLAQAAQRAGEVKP